MGRPERPLDPQAGPVQRFAFDLRSLRESGGRPSYQELAKRAHYAPNTLSEAAKGKKLPTLEVARAFVKACGGDEDAWEQRWWEVHRQLERDQPGSGADTAPTANGAVRSGPPPAAPLPDPVAAFPEPVVERLRPRRPWLAAAVGVAVLALAGAGALWANQQLSPAASPPPLVLPLRLLRAVGEDGGFVRIWALTTDRNQAAHLTRSTRYEMAGRVGDCYTRQEPGTVPVWHHTYEFKDHRYEQHLYTIETDPLRDEALNWGWTGLDSQPVCYVYSSPMPGTKPLYRMREDPLDETNAVRDGHGHVYTPSRPSYQRYGFVVDQVWYVLDEEGRSGR